MVEFLLSQGADANKANKDGLLPLHVASKKGNYRSVHSPRHARHSSTGDAQGGQGGGRALALHGQPIKSSQERAEVEVMMASVVQMRRLGYTELEGPVQGHTHL